MNLTEFSTPDAPSGTTVSRLARVVSESLDPDDEYDCEVRITTVPNEEVHNHSTNDIPTGGYEYQYEDHGVKITIKFSDNADCPNIRLARMIRRFDDSASLEHGITYRESFSGHDGYCEALAFPIQDKEFTCAVHDPSWAN